MPQHTLINETDKLQRNERINNAKVMMMIIIKLMVWGYISELQSPAGPLFILYVMSMENYG
jgi:hypothetical protein